MAMDTGDTKTLMGNMYKVEPLGKLSFPKLIGDSRGGAGLQSPDILLQVEDLRTCFQTEQGLVKAVDGVTFNVGRGETLGIVGESGCGKSITALSILNMVPQPRGRIEGGQIQYYKSADAVIDISALPPSSPEMRDIRGNEIAMIFQEPMSSLTPVYTIGQQIMEAIELHQNLDKKESKELAIEMLRRVQIPAPEQRVNEYPHQLSGGMRQRAMIAMALSCNPSLLIADEPTTALDVTIQAQILDLMLDLQDEYGMSIMLITHDLAVIGEMADRVMVMYMGQVVETASSERLFQSPLHPYTEALLESIPEIGRRRRLTSIAGSVPSPYALPKGCYFAPRCLKARDVCHQKRPPTFNLESDQSVKCWLYDGKGEPDGTRTRAS